MDPFPLITLNEEVFPASTNNCSGLLASQVLVPTPTFPFTSNTIPSLKVEIVFPKVFTFAYLRYSFPLFLKKLKFPPELVPLFQAEAVASQYPSKVIDTLSWAQGRICNKG